MNLVIYYVTIMTIFLDYLLIFLVINAIVNAKKREEDVAKLQYDFTGSTMGLIFWICCKIEANIALANGDN